MQYDFIEVWIKCRFYKKEIYLWKK
jgi:hypothetical protein